MKLPVLEIVTSAYMTVLTRPAQFIVAMVPALVAMLALWGLLLARLMTMPAWTDDSLAWIARGVDALPYAVFGLIWLRFLLCAPATVLLPRPLFGSRGPACFGWAILLSLAVTWQFTLALPALARVLEAGRTGLLGPLSVPVLTVVVLPAVLLGTAYLVARCGLLPVAAAGDAPLSPAAAWRATRGNGARLAGAYLLAGLPAAIAAFALKVAYFNVTPNPIVGAREIVIGTMIAAPLRLAAAALIAAIAVESYHRLVDRGSLHFDIRPRVE